MYPTLTEMVLSMLREDDGDIHPVSEWQWPENVVELETITSGLTSHQRNRLVHGTHFDDYDAADPKFDRLEDSEYWMSAHSVLDYVPEAAKVDAYLNQVMDGELKGYYD